MFVKHQPFIRFGVMALALMMVLAPSVSRLAGAQVGQPPTDQSVAATIGPNLLANPNFDEGGYYFRAPNSLIPPRWYRWDVTPGATIPEFIDGGSAYHNACYPEPPPGGLCENMIPKNRSMGYIKYGGNYIAGGWQPVQVTPCLDYQFAGYVRTDAQGYKPKVGIDPTGWKLAERPGDFGCAGQCYREHFAYESDMPTSTVWSAPYPYDPKPPPIVWRGPVSVTTEALSTTISVWTYTAPAPGSQSTYWDSMSLYEVPKETLLPDGVIPAPDPTVTPTGMLLATVAGIRWNTTRQALAQVSYSPRVTASIPYTYTVYVPIVFKSGTNKCGGSFQYCTTTSVLATSQSVGLTGLQPNTTYDYVAIWRWFDGSACVSAASSSGTFTTLGSESRLFLPVVIR